MNKYDIQATDTFDPLLFPLVTGELSVISKRLSPILCRNRGEIVISFLKDHCLQTSWLSESKETTSLITSREFRTSQIESLFESCRPHIHFRTAFEAFIKKQLEPSA